jgi:Trk K+ transport system NAD-binding subunit
VVVLADRDKVEMDEDIAQNLGDKAKFLRVVTRSGNTHDLHDLGIVSPGSAKSIVIPSPQASDGTSLSATEADTFVLKTMLALSKLPEARSVQLVAELQEPRTLAVAKMIVPEGAALVLSPPLISRLLVQTGRQTGLSSVYVELLDFAGVEIYVQSHPGLQNKTFKEAILAFDTSALMGVATASGELLLPPPLDRAFVEGDRVVVISEDDDTVKLDGKPVTIDPALLVPPVSISSRHIEKTVVLGVSDRVELILKELDAYVAPGSHTIVVGQSAEAMERAQRRCSELKNMTVAWEEGDVTDRELLDRLEIPGFDHALVLAETSEGSAEVADARTLVTLLHLRDIARIAKKKTPVTTEMLDIRNQELAAVAEADDFIVSNTLISLMMSQIAENPLLLRIFDTLFSPEGHEIYLKPASAYIKPGAEVAFGVFVEAAAQRGEVALGYRKDGAVILAPQKSKLVRLGEGEQLVVLAVD